MIPENHQNLKNRGYLCQNYSYMSARWDSKNSIQWQTQEDSDLDVLTEPMHNLIVWNDDVNTFDWVIESLMAICEHSSEQAEQCSLIIHHKGKCGVKKGTFDILRPLAEGLIDRGIQATIDY
jgi:ATP-dependent Clp protease adaptor protein ClpS